jgi:hypothetical protein
MGRDMTNDTTHTRRHTRNMVCEHHRAGYVRSLQRLSCSSSSDDAEHGLTNALDHLKTIFDEYTGLPCCCTIKILDANDRVRTWIRDRKAPAARYEIDTELRRFPATLNSAFRQLLMSPWATYYCENNLGFSVDYKNCNPDWRQHYDACVVAGIRPPATVPTGNRDLIGFFVHRQSRWWFRSVCWDGIEYFCL